MIYLDPFNGSLTILENIMDYTFQNNNKSNNYDNKNSSINNYIETKYKSEQLINVQDYFNLDMKECFGILNNNVLPFTTTNNVPTYNPAQQENNNNNDDEVVNDWLGIDSHPIIDYDKYQEIGTMVCAARTIVLENPFPTTRRRQQQQQHHRFLNPFVGNDGMDDNDVNDDELVVTEI